jgi:hypothetical protein
MDSFKKFRIFLSRFFNILHKTNISILDIQNPAANQLKVIVTQTIDQAQKIKDKEEKIGLEMQNIIDAGGKFLPLIPNIRLENIEDNAISWGALLNQTSLIDQKYMELIPVSDTAGTLLGTAIVSTTGSFVPLSIQLSADPDFVERLNDFERFSYRPTLKKEVVDLLILFQLDTPPNSKKSSLDLFLIAHQAFENPISKNNPSITSLIPMRESISHSLAELIKRLPKQEPSGKSDELKIKLICSQVKKPGISDIVVQEWADQWHEINDKDLSGAKDASLSRDEWERRLNRATLFLKTFLSGLDPTLLKKKLT